MMHLVELLLPLRDRDGAPFPAAQFERLTRELTEAFGGVTAFTRSPAKGRWKDGGKTESDDIIVIEVMAEGIDRAWWAELRQRLERMFRQDEIVIRAQTIERL
jgi:hypothetical protein